MRRICWRDRELTAESCRNWLIIMKHFRLRKMVQSCLVLRLARRCCSNPDGAMNQTGSGGLNPGVMTVSGWDKQCTSDECGNAVLPEEPHTWCYLSPKGYLYRARRFPEAAAVLSGFGKKLRRMHRMNSWNAGRMWIRRYSFHFCMESCPGENEDEAAVFTG